MVVTFGKSHLPCLCASCCSLRCRYLIDIRFHSSKPWHVEWTVFSLCFIHSWLEERTSISLNKGFIILKPNSKSNRPTILAGKSWHHKQCLSLRNEEWLIKSTWVFGFHSQPFRTKSVLSKVLSYAQSCLRRDLASGVSRSVDVEDGEVIASIRQMDDEKEWKRLNWVLGFETIRFNSRI